MRKGPTRRPARRRPLPALLLLLPLLLASPARADTLHERAVTITNESGGRVELHWIRPGTGEMVLQSAPEDLHDGASFALKSFATHSFQVRELPAETGGSCAGADGTCSVDHFTVSWDQDQVVMIHGGVKVEHTDSKTVAARTATNRLEDCKSEAKQQLKREPSAADIILDSLASCLQKGVADEIEKANEEIAFQAQVRKDLAETMENYTCADATVNTTEARRNENWEGRPVRVMIDRPASKIHVVEDFLTQDECAAVEERARPILHDATVADGSGGNKISESRKAKQAGIKVQWDKEVDGDPVARLSRRVYNYVNHVLPFGIRENGQENLMSIQYSGRGPGDDAPDRYMPHCDGQCKGESFRHGKRVATVVMYCEIPAVGGATRFRNSNVHIRPERYAATFFSYIDPETMKMDDGFTEHSGCPVVEGEKKIVTQWVRLGVDNENPWDSFNTLGIKHSDAANQ